MAVRHPVLRTVQGQLTADQVNTGTIVIPARKDRAVTVVDAWLRAIGGAAGSNTSVDVTDGTTIAVSFARAGLAQNAILRAGAANTTATNLGTALATGGYVKVANVGTAMDTATHIDYKIDYVVDGVTLA